MLRGVNEDLAFPLLQRRPTIARNPQPIGVVENRRVMVTGAGGSIGSELVQQIAGMRPSHLTLVELSEYNLYEANATLVEAGVDCQVAPLLADVRHVHAMQAVFAAAEPDIVFHAAALKHVPLLENDHNLLEAVRTNVGGTAVVAQLCSAYRAQMVLVSTDKAVNPASVMGLTKRVAELVALSHSGLDPCLLLSVVRFGNVLGSSGSFVPLFRRQIAQGGPVTVTHPDMRRFLMTIKEAVSLVLQVAEARNGTMAPSIHACMAPPWLFVLEMGRQVRILDVACQLIEQAGLRPGKDVAISFTGVRPGEKLEEELNYADEALVRQVIPGVSGCRLSAPECALLPAIQALLRAADRRQVAEVKGALAALVPSYSGYNGAGAWP